MERKMIIGILSIALALLIVGGGLYAYFSDVQTAGHNIFTTGTLLLQVGSNVPCTENITVNALKPGDSGEGANWHIQNIGSLNGNLSFGVGAINNSENGVNSAEVAAGESPTNTVGDLGANLNVAIWMDLDGSGVWKSGDYYLLPGGTVQPWVSGTTLPAAAYQPLNSYGNVTWQNAQVNLGPGSIGHFKVEYTLPAATTNVVQGDSAVFPITFTLTQTI